MAKRRRISKRRRAALKAARTRKRNKLRRSLAARKAARTRRRRSHGRRVVRKYRKGSKAARRRGRKAARTRRRRGRAMVGLFGSMGGLKKNPRRRRRRKARRNPRRRRYRRNAFAPVLANPRRRRRRRRHNPRRRRHGRRGMLSGFRLRRNPLGGLMAVAKAAIPVVGAMVGGRLIVNKLGGMVADKLGTHAGPVLHAAMAVAGGIAVRKVRFLSRYQSPIMIGLGVNLIEALIKAYAPLSVQAALGAAEGVYDEALGGFQQDMGEYVETGEYMETGAEEELGEYMETGAYEELGAAGGSAMVAPVPTARMLAPVPSRSMVRTVPQWTPAADKLDSLYAGIFGGWGWGY